MLKKKINKNFKNKAVFFDRDGVLNKTILSNESPRSPRRIDEFKLYKSVLKIKDLREDYKIFIISNQPDIGRKLMKISHLNQMNNKINKLNLFDEIVYCYHKDDFSCKCRKPKNGMILYLEKKYNLDLGNSFVIGDRWKDIEAGSKSKCNTIFIDRKYKENSLKKINSTFKCKSLSQALSIIKNFKN